MTTPKALHSVDSVQWGSPRAMVDISRAAQDLARGEPFDLDPATSAEFNARYVRAKRIYTEQDSGLTSDANWVSSSLHINPPSFLVRKFWRRLVQAYEGSEVDQFVWVGFSVSQLATLSNEPLNPLSTTRFSTYIFGARWCFERPDGTAGDRPSHYNYLTHGGLDEGHERFATAVEDFLAGCDAKGNSNRRFAGTMIGRAALILRTPRPGRSQDDG